MRGEVKNPDPPLNLSGLRLKGKTLQIWRGFVGLSWSVNRIKMSVLLSPDSFLHRTGSSVS